MLRIFFSIMVMITMSNAYALDAREAKINLINDYAKCYVFWNIAEQGAPNPNDTYTKNVQKHAEYSLAMGLELTKDIKAKEESFLASIKNMTKFLGKEMGGDYANFSILTSKYLDLCVSLSKGPEERYLYWLSQ